MAGRLGSQKRAPARPILVPEPSRWLLLTAGLGLLVVLCRVRVR
jgi:hypothetical protein